MGEENEAQQPTETETNISTPDGTEVTTTETTQPAQPEQHESD